MTSLGVTFDAGGLIALERDDRQTVTLVRTLLDSKGKMIVPATALAQVLRNPAKQVRLWRLIQHDQTTVVPLESFHAQAVGALLARSRSSDIVDAHVVVCARKYGYAVISSDPLDLARLDPELQIIRV